MPAEHILYQNNTPEGTVQVTERQTGGRTARFLLVKGYMESAMYTEPQFAGDLLFSYMKSFDVALRMWDPVKDLYLIGGGAMAYPRHLLMSRPDIRVTAAEASEEILHIARAYFRLDQLQEEYGGRLTVAAGDAFRDLAERKQLYDVIVHDAYKGRYMDGHTRSNTELVHRHLRKGGLYMINAVTALKGPFALSGHRLMNILRDEFRYAVQLPVNPDRSPWETQNSLVLASDDMI